jgi:hypothetical protein
MGNQETATIPKNNQKKNDPSKVNSTEKAIRPLER